MADLSDRWVLTAERERNMRRDHARIHPDGLTRIRRPCEICMLLDELVRVRARERELAKELEGRDAKIRGYRRALDIAGEKIADIVLEKRRG